MPAAGHEQAELGRRVEWLPGVGKTENFWSESHAFREGIPRRLQRSVKACRHRVGLTKFFRHQFAPFASPAVDETTNFWSESNAGSHHDAEARLLMKPTVAGAGLGMPPERLSVSVDVAIHKIEGI
jgi:hypothetical protein